MKSHELDLFHLKEWHNDDAASRCVWCLSPGFVLSWSVKLNLSEETYWSKVVSLALGRVKSKHYGVTFASLDAIATGRTTSISRAFAEVHAALECFYDVCKKSPQTIRFGKENGDTDPLLSSKGSFLLEPPTFLIVLLLSSALLLAGQTCLGTNSHRRHISFTLCAAHS